MENKLKTNCIQDRDIEQLKKAIYGNGKAGLLADVYSIQGTIQRHDISISNLKETMFDIQKFQQKLIIYLIIGILSGSVSSTILTKIIDNFTGNNPAISQQINK